MDYDFKRLMSKKTDDELITILTVRRDEYTQAAILEAQIEFDKRAIPHHHIEKIEKEQTVLKEEEIERANEPLDSDTRMLAMIFPMIARFMYAEKFRQGGYERKLDEMGEVYWKGRLIFLCIIIVIIVLLKS